MCLCLVLCMFIFLFVMYEVYVCVCVSCCSVYVCPHLSPGRSGFEDSACRTFLKSKVFCLFVTRRYWSLPPSRQSFPTCSKWLEQNQNALSVEGWGSFFDDATVFCCVINVCTFVFDCTLCWFLCWPSFGDLSCQCRFLKKRKIRLVQGNSRIHAKQLLQLFHFVVVTHKFNLIMSNPC